MSVASRYAGALADAVFAEGSGLEPRQALEELRSFAGLVKESAELRNVLVSPAISTSKKRAVIARFSDMLPLSRLVRNFFYVIVDHRRAGIVESVVDAFEVVLDERSGVVRASVTSAVPLDESEARELRESLSRVAGKQVRCEYSVDPELIGGVVARIGSTVYDGSVRSQLQGLRERLTAP